MIRDEDGHAVETILFWNEAEDVVGCAVRSKHGLGPFFVACPREVLTEDEHGEIDRALAAWKATFAEHLRQMREEETAR